jgi:parallel beta-helix repeat protein
VALINIRNVVVHYVRRAVYAKNLWMARFEDFEVQYSGVDVPLIYLDRSTTDITHDIYFDKLHIEDIRSTSSIIYVREPVYNVVLDNCFIENIRQTPYLIYFENWSERNVVSKCLLDGASSYAIRAGIHNIIKGNRITNSGGGIELGLHFNIATDNVISVDDVGIRGNSGYNLIIANNYLAHMNTGIYLDWGSYYSTVVGNVIIDVKRYGIHVYHSEQVRIANNQIYIENTSADIAIRIQDPGRNIVMGNTVRGNLNNSIVEENSDYNIIIGNILEKPMTIVGPHTIVRDNIT